MKALELKFYREENGINYECEETDDYDFFILRDIQDGEELGDGTRGDDAKLEFYKRLEGNVII